jgi:glycerophosphoryl diester phosphodiesterase
MKIIAHRGASAVFPENSIAAFDRAVALGASAIETDVLMTRDNEYILRHDDLLRADGRWQSIRSLTLKDLRQKQGLSEEILPTLKKFLDQYQNQCELILDLKTLGMGSDIARELLKRKNIQNITLASFVHSDIAVIRKESPELQCSLTFASSPSNLIGILNEADIRIVNMHRGTISQADAEKLNAQGIRWRVYTVNWPEEAAKFRSWGADGIFTDDPELMLKSLG